MRPLVHDEVLSGMTAHGAPRMTFASDQIHLRGRGFPPLDGTLPVRDVQAAAELNLGCGLPQLTDNLFRAVALRGHPAPPFPTPDILPLRLGLFQAGRSARLCPTLGA